MKICPLTPIFCTFNPLIPTTNPSFRQKRGPKTWANNAVIPHLFAVLEQYPDKKWTDIIEEIDIKEDKEISDLEAILEQNSSDADDEFASFKL